MNEEETKKAGLKKLREPFPPHQISKLPKPTKAQTDAIKDNYKNGIRCDLCGGWHHKDVIHIDYVGHAALTDRLLDADPTWSWEPLAMNQYGIPAMDGGGGMWIKLTVCGVTRLGYGHAGDKTGGDAIKEVIGDALRNAAMRFGAALELWHKGDLHLEEENDSKEVELKEPQWSPEQMAFMQEQANHIIAAVGMDDIDRAHKIFYRSNLDNEEKLAIWSILKPHSSVRSAIKSYDDGLRELEKKGK